MTMQNKTLPKLSLCHSAIYAPQGIRKAAERGNDEAR